MANKKRKIIVSVIAFVMFVVASTYFYLPRMIADQVYPLAYSDLIVKYSSKYQVDPGLIAGIIFNESRFNPDAKSGTGAKGLMQMVSTTGNTMAKETGYPSDYNLYDPNTSIELGTAHVRDLLIWSNNNVDLAVAAYNLGTGGASVLSRSGGQSAVSNFKYVKNVRHYQTVYQTMYAHELGYTSSPVQLAAQSEQDRNAQVRGYFWVQLFQNVFRFNSSN